MTASASYSLTTPPSTAPVPAQAGTPPVTRQARDWREWMYRQSPGFLRNTWGQRFMGVLGLMLDALSEGTQQAVTARFFKSKTFPDDAYPLLGAERSMPRFPAESLAAYRARVLDAWNAWQQAGTAIGIIDQLGKLGFTATIYQNHEWDWDSDPANWSRIWVVITAHPWTNDGDWGDPGIWGDGGTWGSNASREEVRSVQNLVRQWKPAHVVVEHVIVVLDGGSWSPTPTGDWDRWENRSAAAIYWPG